MEGMALVRGALRQKDAEPHWGKASAAERKGRGGGKGEAATVGSGFWEAEARWKEPKVYASLLHQDEMALESFYIG